MNKNSKGHFNTEAQEERQSVSYANFFLIKFLIDNKQYIYRDDSIYVCEGWVHVCKSESCVSCVHLYECASITVKVQLLVNDHHHLSLLLPI